MSTIDFNKPATTDLYTAWPTSIQGNQQSLGFMLDPTYVTSYSNLVTGMKRWNAGLVEQWSGTAWAAATAGYILKAGDTGIGALTLNNNVALSWKDSGGTARTIGTVNASNGIYLGDVSNAITSSVLHLVAQSSLSFEINSAVAATLTASALSVRQVVASGTAEGLRLQSDSAYIGFWNGANSLRSGYIQGQAGGLGFGMIAENGNNLQLGTASTVKATLDTAGNIGLGVTPSTWSGNYRVLEMPNGCGINAYTGGVASMSLVSNSTYNGTSSVRKIADAAAQLIVQSGAFFFYNAPTGTAGSSIPYVQAMTLDGSGNLLLGLTTPTSASAGRGLLEVNGTSNALITLCTGGTRRGYFYFNGTNVLLNADTGTLSLNNAAGSVVLQTNGATQFNGGAYTQRIALGSQATITVDWSKGNYFTMTLTANVAAGGWLFSNAQDGQTITIKITQDGTGSRTIAANSALKWPGGTLGVLSTAPGAIDLLCLTFDAVDNKYYCTLSKGFA